MQYVEPLEGRTLFATYPAATVPELISAMNAANASAEADTITLAAGATFSLTSYRDTAEARSGLVVPPNSGGLTLLGVLFGDLTSLVLGGSLIAIAVRESRSAARLQRFETTAPRHLATNQAVLGAVIVLYAVWQAWSSTANIMVPVGGDR